MKVKTEFVVGLVVGLFIFALFIFPPNFFLLYILSFYLLDAGKKGTLFVKQACSHKVHLFANQYNISNILYVCVNYYVSVNLA